jgi:hypothetical protein
MGLFKNISGIVDKGVGIIDELVVDKDKALELKVDLAKSVAEKMLTDKGASFTKVTICVLVSILTMVGVFTYLFRPEEIIRYKDLVVFISPLIGTLIGGYATGTTIQKIKK